MYKNLVTFFVTFLFLLPTVDAALPDFSDLVQGVSPSVVKLIPLVFLSSIHLSRFRIFLETSLNIVDSQDHQRKKFDRLGQVL